MSPFPADPKRCCLCGSKDDITITGADPNVVSWSCGHCSGRYQTYPKDWKGEAA